ncbi:MAG: hypothetical protein ABJC89_20590, partial [Acidobacteriota bacterium]
LRTLLRIGAPGGCQRDETISPGAASLILRRKRGWRNRVSLDGRGSLACLSFRLKAEATDYKYSFRLQAKRTGCLSCDPGGFRLQAEGQAVCVVIPVASALRRKDKPSVL